MQAGSKKLLLASPVDGKELLFLSHRRTCERKQLRLLLEVTGSIHLVTPVNTWNGGSASAAFLVITLAIS